MSSLSSRSAVLSLYREMITLIKAQGMPDKQQKKALSQLQDGFRKNINIEESKIPSLLEVCNLLRYKWLYFKY